MKSLVVRSLTAVGVLVVMTAGIPAAQRHSGQDVSADTLIAMERAALDRWGNGDPSGYLEIYAPDIVYFDPSLDRRLDGIDAVTRHLEQVRGKISIPRYELLNPLVQQVGDAAVLTFNYVSYGPTGQVTRRWNLTEVYRRLSIRWAIVQSHWSYTRGQPPSER